METTSTVRVEALRLLLVLPSLTGALSTAGDATWLLRQIIQSSLLEGDGAATIPYLDLMDELERVAAFKPDVRWYLHMFCKHPVSTMEWAHKGYMLQDETSPSRLVDWLLAAWLLWQQEQRRGPEAVAATPVELRFTTLGVEIAKVTLRQIPVRETDSCRYDSDLNRLVLTPTDDRTCRSILNINKTANGDLGGSSHHCLFHIRQICGSFIDLEKVSYMLM
jgi:hypothetical protein